MMHFIIIIDMMCLVPLNKMMRFVFHSFEEIFPLHVHCHVIHFCLNVQNLEGLNSCKVKYVLDYKKSCINVTLSPPPAAKKTKKKVFHFFF